MNRSRRAQYRCSFCGKSQEQVKRLIAGPGGVYICDECIDLCQEITAEEMRSAPPLHQSVESVERRRTIARLGGLRCVYCKQVLDKSDYWILRLHHAGHAKEPLEDTPGGLHGRCLPEYFAEEVLNNLPPET